MADNVNITPGSGDVIAADDVSSVKFQRVKLDVGGDGLSVPVTSIASGAVDTVLGATSDAAVDTDTTGTVSGKLRGLVKLVVNLLSRWPAALGAGGGLKVDGSGTALPVGGDVAHDAADSGNPVKAGGKAVAAFPTAVTANDRANFLTDLFGRVLTGRRPVLTQKSFHAQYAAQQTGATVWTPASGKRIIVESVVVSGYGSTAGHVNLWFASGGDTTYSIGTDQPLFNCRLLPSAVGNQAPCFVFAPSEPVECLTTDAVLAITTDAAVSLHVTVHGYEAV